MLRGLLALTLLTTAPLTLAAQWTLHDAHTTADLRGIDNVGHGVAWASGSHGTILRTEDAGIVWQLCATPPGGEHLDFRAIQAFDNSTAIIMSIGKGDQSRLYKTTDGCQTWKFLFTNPDPDGFWDALQFARPVNPGALPLTRERRHSFGALLGDPVNDSFVLFITRDGGNHWTRQINPALAAKASEQGAFAASNSSLLVRDGFVAFAVGGTGGAAIYFETALATCDNCASNETWDGARGKWLRVEVPVGSRTESAGIFSVAYGESTHPRPLGNSITEAVGGDYTKPGESNETAAYFDFGSKHWTAATTPPHGFRSAVAYDPTTKTWITVGPNGTDISTDDGRNWRALHPDPRFNDTPDADQHWNALSLPYAVGPHGRIGTLRPSALTPSK